MTLAEQQAAIATALQPLLTALPQLQVFGFYNTNPSPPSIDLYPGDPSQDGAGFGVDDKRCYFTIRARVAVTDDQAGQQLLLRLMDPGDPASVEQALAATDVAAVTPEGVSGFREYTDGADGRLLGCEWRVEAFL